MSSPKIKNIMLVEFGKSGLDGVILGPHEGRFAIVTERRAGVVMDALASGVTLLRRTKTSKRTAKSYGPDAA